MLKFSDIKIMLQTILRLSLLYVKPLFLGIGPSRVIWDRCAFSHDFNFPILFAISGGIKVSC